MDISLKSLKINNIADYFQSFCRGKYEFDDFLIMIISYHALSVAQSMDLWQELARGVGS